LGSFLMAWPVVGGQWAAPNALRDFKTQGCEATCSQSNHLHPRSWRLRSSPHTSVAQDGILRKLPHNFTYFGVSSIVERISAGEVQTDDSPWASRSKLISCHTGRISGSGAIAASAGCCRPW